MTVTDVRKDLEAKTMTITTELDAPVERVWQLWADPRLLERWWGPPTYPATFVDHDLSPGGRMRYFMTGPEGDKAHGWWKVLRVDEPHGIEMEDGFADDAGEPRSDMPTMVMSVSIQAVGDARTRMSITTTFPSTEDMERLVAMGMEEGMQQAIGQIDGLLST